MCVCNYIYISPLQATHCPSTTKHNFTCAIKSMGETPSWVQLLGTEELISSSLRNAGQTWACRVFSVYLADVMELC